MRDANILYLSGTKHANDAMQIITDICPGTIMKIRPNKHIMRGGLDPSDYIVDVLLELLGVIGP